MRSPLLGCAAALITVSAGGTMALGQDAAAASPATTRRTIDLLAGWRFQRGDEKDGPLATLDDAKWRVVQLPHSFNGEDGERGDYYRGPAWYRRALMLRAPQPGRRLFIQFDGAATVAELFLNGRPVGRHAGGHAAFRFDLTPHLKAGRNLLAVRVSNAPDDAVTPLGGDFTVFGGLYRKVSLIETDDVHLDLADHGGPGVYARTAALTPARAEIEVRARVANDGRSQAAARVRFRLLDASGRAVATASAQAPAATGTTAEARATLSVPSPRLWNGVKDPYLYRVEVQLAGGDAVTVPLGIRTMAIDPARGFLLNGRSYPLRGVNLMHSARPGRGTAVRDEEIAEDFAILREMGSTGVRLVHFQHPHAAYDEADRRGLVAWTEIGINSRITDTPAFRANAVQQMRELIAQSYNSPSVAMWGIGNEVYSEDPSVTRTLEVLHRAAQAADPHRPTVYAHCCNADDAPKALVSSVIGFNRYYGWYADQSGQTLGGWAAGFHRRFPNRALAISEYGAGASAFQHEDPPRAVVTTSGWHPEQYQALYHEKNWRELADKPYIFGNFIWVGFDLASGGRNEGDRAGINDKGLVTYDRQTRKDAWYWYQANWSDRAMLHLTAARWTRRTTADTEVKAYSNAPSAELWLNGRAVGRAPVTGRIARWRVRLLPGDNRVEVRSGALRDAATWTYAPAPALLSGEPVDGAPIL